jgi:hypothetical protein
LSIGEEIIPCGWRNPPVKPIPMSPALYTEGVTDIPEDARISWVAYAIACAPDPQTRFTVLSPSGVTPDVFRSDCRFLVT